MRKTILLCLLIHLVFLAHTQNIKGSWKDYLAYTNATKVAVGGEKIYCATEGGLFFYDMQDNSINKFSGVYELSDFGINTIAYSNENKVLVVAYNNSNIDLVYESGVINLSDIKRKQITGDKSINNISFIGKQAYLSCGFGIVVLNIEKREVKDTYFIGEGGASVSVFDVEADDLYLYAATESGILKADKTGSNLLDFQNWTRIENIVHSKEKFDHLETHAGKIIANYSGDQNNQDEMYIQTGSEWSVYLPEIKHVYDIQSDGDNMVITGQAGIYVIDDNHSLLGKLDTYQLNGRAVTPIQARSANLSYDGTLWIADYSNSLVKVSGQNFEAIYPSGPLNNSIFAMSGANSDVWIAAGGRTESWNNAWQAPLFQRYNSNGWTYFYSGTFSELNGFSDVVDVLVDPNDPAHIFVGSWGGGVLEFRNDQFQNRFTNKNSLLQSAIPQSPDEPFVRIGGMDFDSEGNLWVTNSGVAQNLLKYSAQGEWEAFTLPEVANNKSIGRVVVTQNDDKWIQVPRGNNAYVVDKTGERKKRLIVRSYFNNGKEEKYTNMNDIYSMVVDNEGAIWMGTSVGVAVYNHPSGIWNSDAFYASQPGLGLNDGLYHPLLSTETVTAIAVDGANRKWLGTKNSGVYLISENGEKEIQHFTKENSPLLSNTIKSIALNPKSGEVFFGTDKGLISYQGDATEGNNNYSNVYVYPNPVRETYEGPVTVTGLIENTDVKITDISGNLVFKTTSFGGDAVWDGNNLNGNRVKTGVYLVFCNDENGEETHITKLLFIH